jgi:hypothetical protein
VALCLVAVTSGLADIVDTAVAAGSVYVIFIGKDNDYKSK